MGDNLHSHVVPQVHQLLQMLKDQDADSAYSGDGSNTDSGRGASEEGETSHSNGFPNNGHHSNGPYHGNPNLHMYGQHSKYFFFKITDQYNLILHAARQW